VLFSPLSRYYTTQLNRNLQQLQGLLSVKKGNFFLSFWEAWRATIRLELILKSFKATGVWLIDSEVILKRFNATTLDKDKDIELRELGNRDT
jgi:hypothetical protein